MDYKGLIDFNKYTLALAAASFAYALEKFVPMPTAAGRYLVLSLLALFMLSVLSAVLLFAVATAALHRSETKASQLKPLVRWLGNVHAALLLVGLLVLGSMLVSRVLAEPQKDTTVCCMQSVVPAST